MKVDSGLKDNDWVTNKGTVTVENVQKGAVLEYSTDGGQTWTRLGVGVTEFELPQNTQLEGKKYKVQVKQIINDVSSEVAKQEITYDTVAPKATFSTITETGNKFTVKGSVDENSQIKLVSGSETIKTKEYSEKSEFDFTIDFKESTKYSLEFSDLAGNKGENSDSINIHQYPKIFEKQSNELKGKLSDANDIIYVKGTGTNNGDIGFAASSGKVNLNTGKGNDFIFSKTVQTGDYNSTTLNMGDGDDTLLVSGYIRHSGSIGKNSFIDINMGSGNDKIIVGAETRGSEGGIYTLPTGKPVNINLGEGNDYIQVSNAVSGNVTIDGGKGFDTFALASNNDRAHSINQSLSKFKNINMIDLTGDGKKGNTLSDVTKDYLTNNNNLYVKGDSNDRVNIGYQNKFGKNTKGFNKGGTTVKDDVTYDIWTDDVGQNTIYIQKGIEVF